MRTKEANANKHECTDNLQTNLGNMRSQARPIHAQVFEAGTRCVRVSAMLEPPPLSP